MRKAKVLFDYEPAEDDELALKVGEIISEVKDADVGWCEGLLNGKRGMFPDNFVEVLKEEEEKKGPAPPAANKKPSKKKVTRRLKVNFAYTADNEDEISLEIGDIIDIMKDVEEGWAEGINRGKKGVFPTNFGEIIEAGSDSAEETSDNAGDSKGEVEAEDKLNEEVAAVPQKKVKGVGFGNIFGDGPIKLRQRSIGDADKKKNLSTTPPKPVSTPAKEKEPAKDVTPAKPKKTLHYCKVMFDYVRDGDDELELKKGEIVVILNKNPGDDGWWEGEKDENGKRRKGVFPDNFVIEMTPDEVKDYERQLQAKADPETPKETKVMKPQNKELKKVTPLLPVLPSQAVKPVLNNDFAMNDSTETHFTEPNTTEHTLTHMKRPAGPKNRRKPGATERREKASAITEVENGAEETSEEEDAKPEKPPQPAPKKESVKRGVAVLPGLGGGGGEGATGEAPSWLQNLKNRQSVRKPPPPSQTKEPSPSEPPAWLAGLKKRQSSEFPEKPAPPTPKEKATLQPKPAPGKVKPAVDKPANDQAALIPPAKPAALKPAQKSSSPLPTEKPSAAWLVERQQRSKKTKTETPEEKAPEPPSEQLAAGVEAPPHPTWKNSLTRKPPAAAVKSPTETHPHSPTAFVKKPDKPPIGIPVATPIGAPRAKPPPPKGKPPPAAKPASSTAVEELKNEMKKIKDEMEKTRNEMRKEISRMNAEIQNERNHRISLEEEVRKLHLQVSS